MEEMAEEQLSSREQVLKNIALRLAAAKDQRRVLMDAKIRQQEIAKRVGIDQEKLQRCEKLGLDIEKLVTKSESEVV